MVRRAGYDDLAATIEANGIDENKMDEVEDLALTKARDERRTVTHFRGDHIYEAGNIRFGVEFRDNIGAANDRGVAIHVLTDHLGQEFELLAFDCFEIAPHYHYGPRNQDVRDLLGRDHQRQHPGLDPGPVQGRQPGQHD